MHIVLVKMVKVHTENRVLLLRIFCRLVIVRVRLVPIVLSINKAIATDIK